VAAREAHDEGAAVRVDGREIGHGRIAAIGQQETPGHVSGAGKNGRSASVSGATCTVWTSS
jgi:hypothetical protein